MLKARKLTPGLLPTPIQVSCGSLLVHHKREALGCASTNSEGIGRSPRSSSPDLTPENTSRVLCSPAPNLRLAYLNTTPRLSATWNYWPGQDMAAASEPCRPNLASLVLHANLVAADRASSSALRRHLNLMGTPQLSCSGMGHSVAAEELSCICYSSLHYL